MKTIAVKLMLIMLFASSTSYAQVIIGGGDWCPSPFDINKEVDAALESELKIVVAATPGVKATTLSNYKSDQNTSNVIGSDGHSVIGTCLHSLDLSASAVAQMEKDGQACEATLAVTSQYLAREKIILNEISGLAQCVASAPNLSEDEAKKYFEKLAVYDASPYVLKSSEVSSLEKIVGANGEITYNAVVTVKMDVEGKACTESYKHSAKLSQDKLLLSTEAVHNPLSCK